MTLRLALDADMVAAGLQRPSLRVSKVASLLEVDVSTVYKMIRSGQIKAHKIGKRGLRVFADSVRDFQENNCADTVSETKKNNAKTSSNTPWRSQAYKESVAYLQSMGCM